MRSIYVGVRLHADDLKNLEAVTEAMKDGALRPDVNMSEAMRAALRIAAGSMSAPIAKPT